MKLFPQKCCLLTLSLKKYFLGFHCCQLPSHEHPEIRNLAQVLQQLLVGHGDITQIRVSERGTEQRYGQVRSSRTATGTFSLLLIHQLPRDTVKVLPHSRELTKNSKTRKIFIFSSVFFCWKDASSLLLYCFSDFRIWSHFKNFLFSQEVDSLSLYFNCLHFNISHRLLEELYI